MSSTIKVDTEGSKECKEKHKIRTPSLSSEKTFTYPGTDKEGSPRRHSPLKSNLPKLIPHRKEDYDIKGDFKVSPVRDKILKPKVRPDKSLYKIDDNARSDELNKTASKKVIEELKIKKEFMDKMKENRKYKDGERLTNAETEGELEQLKEEILAEGENEESTKSLEKIQKIEKIDEDDSTTDFQSCLGIDEGTLLGMEGTENKKISEEVWLERQNLIITDLNEIMKDTKEPKFDKMIWINRSTVSNSLLKGKLELRSKKLLGQEPPPPPVTVVGPKYVQDFYDQALKEISEVWLNTSNIISAVRDHTFKFFGKKNKSIDKEQLVLEAEMLQLAIDFAIHFSRLRTDFLLKKVRNRLQVKEARKSELETFMESKTLAALYNEEDLSGMARTIRDLSASICKEKF